MVQRWTFYDPQTLALDTIFLNPQEMRLPTREKGLSYTETTAPGPEGRAIATEGVDKVGNLGFNGTALTLDNVTFLENLWAKRYQVKLTDHFDREWWIYIFKLELTVPRTMRPHLERHKYTMDSIVLDWPT